MEVKKSEKASLENKRFLFVEIGFVVALLAVLGAFEWSSKEKADTSLLAENSEIIDEEIIPITQETPPPPPEMAKVPILSDQIDIIDDDIKVNDNIINLEDDANEFSKWVNQRLNYPDVAKENGVQGRVMLQFTVGTDGSVSNVQVVRGVDPSLDREAVRVVSSSPKWKPGRQRDRAVKVTYTFPVYFQLR